MGWASKMERARRLHRPSLKDWERDGLHETFPSYVEGLSKLRNYQRFTLNENGSRQSCQIVDSEQQQQHPQQQQHEPDQPHCIPVVLDAATLTVEDFHENYEQKRFPCVIRNIPVGHDGGMETTPWKAQESWTLEALEKDLMLNSRVFKCGEDDDGKNIKVKLKHFLKYTRRNTDDSPLYIFDSAFDEDRYANQLLKHYRVPSYFKEDLFNLVSERRRPPYRWFLVGPQRSGTCVHIDPLSTSAWNTLITGRKRWVLFPPHISKDIVKGKGLVRKDEDDEAIHYFTTILPRIKRKAESLRSTPPYEGFCCFEFTQYAGETVFVPYGWWHAVLNLEDTVAITQNYCSRRNFDNVWLKTRTGRKRMAWKWLCQLEIDHPDLADRAKELNRLDGFVMKYDPEEIERREREARERKEEAKRQNHIQALFRRHGWERNLCQPHRPTADQENSVKRSRLEASSRPTVSP